MLMRLRSAAPVFVKSSAMVSPPLAVSTQVGRQGCIVNITSGAPRARAKLDEHLQHTRGQALRVRRCIERLGGSTSMIKDVTGKVVAIGQSISGLFVSDEPVKAALAVSTFEQMKIASYKIL